nr:hypothetical protein CFP56_46324 [Quercus suber]
MPATKRLLYILFISPTCSTLNLHRAVKGEGFTVDDLTIGYNARPEKDQAVTLAVAATDSYIVSLLLNQNKDLKNTQIPIRVNFPNSSFGRSTLSTVKIAKGVASSTVSMILDESTLVCSVTSSPVVVTFRSYFLAPLVAKVLIGSLVVPKFP